MNPESIGPYRIVEPLREGGVASVYKALGPDGAAVALKVFAAGGLDAARFQRQVASVIPLAHPNILRVLASGEEGGRFWVASELFAGGSLERLLRARRLTVPQSLAVARGICRGLAHAHARGFVHGHLAPRHVLVAPELAAVKVADFGPSELDVVSDLDTTLRTGAYALGSMHYLAPEQVGRRGTTGGASAVAAAGIGTTGTGAAGAGATATGASAAAAGAGQPDPRVDVYAAGAILVELLTGHPPGGKVALPSHVNAELPPATDVLVLKCLARDPAERYPSAAALLADLDRLEEALRLRLHAHLRGVARLLGPPGSTRRTLVLAALAVLLVALALGGWLLAR